MKTPGTSELVTLNSTRKLAAFLSLVAAALCPLSANAATFTWDASGTGATHPTDGSGTWSTTGTNWSNGTSDAGWNNSDVNDNAVFGDANGAAGTVTVSGPISVGNITFNAPGSGSYTLTSGTITLTSGTIATNATTSTIASVLAGSVGLTSTGAGTLILDGANTYTGTTTVAQGTLQLNSTSGPAIPGNVTFGTGSASINPIIATLQPNQFASGSVISFVNNIGGYTRLVLDGNNQAVGGLSDSIGAGVIENVDAPTYNPSATGTLAINVASGATYSYGGFLRNVDGAGSTPLAVVVGGTGQQTLTGANISYTGPTTINSGTLALQGATSFASAVTVNFGGALALVNTTASPSGGLTVNSGGVLALDNTTAASAGFGGRYFFTSSLSGSGTLDFTGPGLVYFRASTNQVTMTGGINILSGGVGTENLVAAFGNCTAPLFIGSGAFFDVRSTNCQFDSLSGAGSVVNSFSTGVTLTIGDANGSGTFSGVIQNGGNSFTNNTGTGTIALTKTGTGIETLTGSNTYTGATTINAGTLQIGNGSTGSLSNSTAITTGSLGTITFDEVTSSTQSNTISNGGMVVGAEGAGIVNTLSGAISGTGQLTQSGSGMLILNNASDNYSGATTVSSGTLALQDTTAFGSTTTVNAGGSLILNRTVNGFANRSNVSGLITGSGTINVNNATSGIGGGWVTFNSAPAGLSNFTGTVNVNSGVLSMDNLAGVWTGNPKLNVVSGGLFALRGQNISVDALTGNGDVFNDLSGGVNLTVGAANGSGTFSGVIHGANASTGDGTIEQGLLSLIKSGTGVEILTGSSTYAGTTTINSGTLQIGNGSTTGAVSSSSSISGSSTGTLAFDLSSSGTFSNTISGAVAVTQNGSGSITLSSPSYTGATTINSGTLALLSSNFGSSNVTVNSGGVLNLVNSTATRQFFTQTISGAGTLNLSGTGLVYFRNAVNQVSVTGGINILSGGLGTDNLVAAFQNCTAPLSISSGAFFDTRGTNSQFDSLSGAGSVINSFSTGVTLTVGAANGSGTFSGVIQNGGNAATSALNSGTGTIALTKAGTGTEIFSGANTYTGATTVSGGTLVVSGSISGTASVSATGGATLEVDGLLNNSATTSLTGGALQGTGSVGAVTLASASTLSPGYTASSAFGASTSLSAGSVTFSDTASTLSIGIGIVSGSDNTQLASSGTVTLDKTPLQLTLGAAADNPANQNLVYVIVNGGAGSTGSGTDLFTYNGATVANNGTFLTGGGYTFKINYGVNAADTGAGSDIDLTLTAIPEPGTWATILGGFAMLIGLQRRRRSRLK